MIVAPTPDPRAQRTTAPMPQSRIERPTAGNQTAGNPVVAPVLDAGPVGYAMSQANPNGNIISGAARGFMNALAYKQDQAKKQGALEEAAAGLEGHPDLQRYVRSGLMEAPKAAELAEVRAGTKKKDDEAAARRQEIGQLLRNDPDLAHLADPFEAGAISEDNVWDVLKPKEEPKVTPTEDQKVLEQINSERESAGQEALTMEQYLKEKKGSRKLTAAEIKELFETDDSVSSGKAVVEALGQAIELNDTAWDGPLADVGTQVGSLVGDANSVDTQELKNLVTSQALDQLKATFGSMPTEGERKILLEIQGAVTQSRAVRGRIFERALRMARRRVEYNVSKAEAMRSGKYFEEGFAPYEDAPEDAVINGETDAAIPAPEGIDSSIWDEMTPEEKALWD